MIPQKTKYYTSCVNFMQIFVFPFFLISNHQFVLFKTVLSLAPVPTHARDDDVVLAHIDQQGFKGDIKFSQYNLSHVQIVVKMEYPGNFMHYVIVGLSKPQSRRI